MEAKHLRIGNYIQDVNHPERECIVFRLTSGCDYSIAYSYNKAFEDSYAHQRMDALQPIPLTEDWLLRFGFDKETRVGENKYYKDRYLIENGISQFFDNGYSFRITTDNQNSTHAASVKYVHQLQNLYFALTGTELELK